MGMNWYGIGENFIGGTINQIGSGLVSSLFGPSVKKQLKWQKEAQMELNRDAAHINYQYGEMAAQNAYNRQMKMYERSYNDQTFGAMRNQMENAGLSVGLMYGGSGSGGGAGQMSGAPQGATGGAVAGDAAAQLSAAIAMKQLKIQEATAFAQNAKAYAEAEEIKSRNEKNEAETGKTSAETEQIKVAIQQARDSFEWTLKNLKEEAKGEWLDNEAKKFNMEVNDLNTVREINDEKFGKLSIKARGIFNLHTINEAIEVAIKNKDVEGANMLRAVQAAYTNEQTRWKATEVYTAVRLANVAERNASTAEKNAATELLKTKIQELATESNVKLNDAMITKAAQATRLQALGLTLEASKAWAEIDALEKTTDFNTGGWAKTKIVLQGIGSIGGIAANVATKGSYNKAKEIERRIEDTW